MRLVNVENIQFILCIQLKSNISHEQLNTRQNNLDTEPAKLFV